MLLEHLKIGDRVEMTLLKDKSINKVFISQVEEIIDESHLILHTPITYGKLVKLPTDLGYSCLFLTGKCMLRYDTMILEYFKKDGFHLMRVQLTSDGEKIQRRDFFRFECLLPIKFALINDDVEEEVAPDMHEGIIKDVGGGGLRFVTNVEMPESGEIKCLIMLNSEYLLMVAKILSRQYFPKSSYKYQYRCIFIGVLPSEQEKIVRYIFNEQRKNLRRQGN